ncbi:polysaccharide lyase [Paraflavisolibacter sp. H34]|uniref:polysaccharide lyase n=1 Tax=Huijunlia imazamoxiresistens TaxID=3127457 RepID=UPI003016150F
MNNLRTMLTATKTICLSALCVSALLSCSKNYSQEPSLQHEANTVATAAQPSNSALFVDETMEGSSPFVSFGGNPEVAPTNYSYTFPGLAFEGGKSVRFEIRKDQPKVGSSSKIRSEVTVIRGSEWPGFGKEAWYSFAIYFPAQGFEADNERDCINQWFEDGSDETTIRCQSDKAFLEVTPPAGSVALKKYDLFGSSLNGSSVTTGSVSGFKDISKDQWHQFVFHFIHSTGSDGLIEVWRDGVKIHEIKGRNSHLKVPKWKIGLYKASFLNGTSNRNSRVLYFDNVRVGNAKATLADMMSGTNTVINPPVTEDTTGSIPSGDTTNVITDNEPETPVTHTQQVVSYTLIDADDNKDLMTITPGATISLKKLGSKKLNIRANTINGTPGVIKFEMSGALNKTRFDHREPYALFGDDRDGDYFEWKAAPGTYTIKATPYAGTKSKLGAVQGSTISATFTLVK